MPPPLSCTVTNARSPSAPASTGPALRGYGRDRVPDNLSVQPLDYTAAVLTVLAVVWAVVAVWLAARLTHVRRPPPGAPRPPTRG